MRTAILIFLLGSAALAQPVVKRPCRSASDVNCTNQVNQDGSQFPTAGGGSGISACSTTPPTTGAANSYCYDTNNALWKCANGASACTLSTQWVSGAANAYRSGLIAGPDSTKTITGATHGFTTSAIAVFAYDSATPRNALQIGWTWNAGTFDVVITFASAQSNYYVVIMASGTGPVGPQGPAGAGGNPSIGAANHVQIADGAGAFLDAGCTIDPTTHLLTCTPVGGVASMHAFTQGTANTAPANSVGFQAPASVTTKFLYILPGAPTTGLMLATGTSDPVTVTHVPVVPVANGGTALATQTAHALYAGNATSAPTAIGPDASTTKALFSAGASADPAFRAIATGDLPAIPLTGVATQAADTVVMNATSGSAAPTAVAMPTCTTGASRYNTSSHAWECPAIGAAPTGVLGSSDTLVCSAISGETAFATTYTVAANTFTANHGLDWKTIFSYVSSGSPPTMQMRLRVGAGTSGTILYAGNTQAIDSSVTFQSAGMEMLLQGTAAAGASVPVEIGCPSCGAKVSSVYSPWNFPQGTGFGGPASPVSLATNGSIVLQWTMQCSATTVGNSMTLRQMLVTPF